MVSRIQFNTLLKASELPHQTLGWGVEREINVLQCRFRPTDKRHAFVLRYFFIETSTSSGPAGCTHGCVSHSLSPLLPSSCLFRYQGLLDFAFGPLFGVTGYPSYFYLSYTCQLDDGVSGRCVMAQDRDHLFREGQRFTPPLVRRHFRTASHCRQVQLEQNVWLKA